MSNIYLKERRSQKFDFQGLKNLSPGQFWGAPNHARYYSILKLFVATYKSDVWEQNCVQLFYYFNFERSYDVLESKSPYAFLNKNINFNENTTSPYTKKLYGKYTLSIL